jgi:hypothetical protein
MEAEFSQVHRRPDLGDLEEVVVISDDESLDTHHILLEVRVLSPGRSTLNLRVNSDSTASGLDLLAPPTLLSSFLKAHSIFLDSKGL